jgi:RecJ-like exonuclease
MTKKQREIYKKQIDEMTDAVLMNAYRSTFDIASQIYEDILRTLRDKIDKHLTEQKEL